MFVSTKKYEAALDKINDLMTANDQMLSQLNALVISNAKLQEQAEADDAVIASLRLTVDALPIRAKNGRFMSQRL